MGHLSAWGLLSSLQLHVSLISHVGIQHQLRSFLGGSLTVSSMNPFDIPQIDLNLLASEFDIFTYRESVKASQRFFSAPAWKDYVVALHQPPANATSNEELDTYLRQNTIPASHASGTCVMSASDAQYGVVNPDLRVKGIQGLRIADASVMVRFPFLVCAEVTDLVWFDICSHSSQPVICKFLYTWLRKRLPTWSSLIGFMIYDAYQAKWCAAKSCFVSSLGAFVFLTHWIRITSSSVWSGPCYLISFSRTITPMLDSKCCQKTTKSLVSRASTSKSPTPVKVQHADP